MDSQHDPARQGFLGKWGIRALDTVFGIFAATLLLGNLIALLYLRMEPWADTRPLASWLIAWTPAGGYVRRGLPGEWLWWLNHLGVAPQHIIFPLCVATLLAVAWWFAATALKRGCNWWILPTSFCLGGLSAEKDDFFFLLVVMAMVRAHARIQRPWLRFLAVNLFGVLAVNLHEVSFFLTVPFMLLLLWREGRGWKDKALRAASLAPTCLAFLVAARFKGDGQIARDIVVNWTAVLKDGYWDGVPLLTDGTYFLSQTASGLWGAICHNLFREGALGLPNAFWLACLGAGIFLAAAQAPMLYREKRGDGRTLPTLLLFQALALSPLFPVFYDYSRLFAIWILSSYWFWFQIGEERLRKVFPFRIGIGTWNTPLRQLVVVAILCFAGLSSVQLDLRNCVSRSVAGHFVRICILVPREAGGSPDRFFRLFSRHESVRHAAASAPHSAKSPDPVPPASSDPGGGARSVSDLPALPAAE